MRTATARVDAFEAALAAASRRLHDRARTAGWHPSAWLASDPIPWFQRADQIAVARAHGRAYAEAVRRVTTLVNALVDESASPGGYALAKDWICLAPREALTLTHEAIGLRNRLRRLLRMIS